MKFKCRSGSPPHARGKAAPRLPPLRQRGITPARAGKSTPPHSPVFFIWDHPRTRGEKYARAIDGYFDMGSPPHARGKVCAFPVYFCTSGITPARAGKRIPPKIRGFFEQDHPRTRGEKMPRKFTGRGCLGSPPHARGKDEWGYWEDTMYGITPARAGKRHKSFCHRPG